MSEDELNVFAKLLDQVATKMDILIRALDAAGCDKARLSDVGERFDTNYYEGIGYVAMARASRDRQTYSGLKEAVAHLEQAKARLQIMKELAFEAADLSG